MMLQFCKFLFDFEQIQARCLRKWVKNQVYFILFLNIFGRTLKEVIFVMFSQIVGGNVVPVRSPKLSNVEPG